MRFDINGCRGQMHFSATITLCVVHFLPAGHDSIFSESLWGPWTATHAAAHPIKIKWLLGDSLSTDKLFVNSAWHEKKKLSLFRLCLHTNVEPPPRQQHISSVIHQKVMRRDCMGENMLHQLSSKANYWNKLYVFNSFGAILALWCQCQRATVVYLWEA